MYNEIESCSRALEALKNRISSISDYENLISRRKKEISTLKTQVKEYEHEIEKCSDKARIFAARYFTTEKISEIFDKAKIVLKRANFDKDEYIKIFSDSSKVTLAHIMVLLDVEKSINEVESELNENNSGDDQVPMQNQDIFSRITDSIKKEYVNHD